MTVIDPFQRTNMASVERFIRKKMTEDEREQLSDALQNTDLDTLINLTGLGRPFVSTCIGLFNAQIVFQKWERLRKRARGVDAWPVFYVADSMIMLNAPQQQDYSEITRSTFKLSEWLTMRGMAELLMHFDIAVEKAEEIPFRTVPVNKRSRLYTVEETMKELGLNERQLYALIRAERLTVLVTKDSVDAFELHRKSGV